MKAGGAGGLGGDDRDAIVSFTVERAVAEQLAEDIRLAAVSAKSTPVEVHVALQQKAITDGWSFDAPLPKDYSVNDVLRSYFTARESAVPGKRNPLFFNSDLTAIDPAKVGIIEIRERSDVPVVFLAEGGSDQDRLLAFDLGADDYIQRPAAIERRFHALLRRRLAPPGEVLEGPRGITLRVAAHEVRVSGTLVVLTPVNLTCFACC